MDISNLQYFNSSWCVHGNEVLTPEVCVYGGTAAGVIAAMTVIEEGRSCLLLHPGRYLGGMTTGGLSYTDIGNTSAIGGSSRRFYERIGSRYDKDVAWTFEPHVAADVLREMIETGNLPVRYGEFVDEVTLTRRRITEIKMYSGLRVRAKAFIDASYEGDLMARSDVPYAVGREASDEYGEEYAGTQLQESHQFDCEVAPHLNLDDHGNGLLPGVKGSGVARRQEYPVGKGDTAIQAYNFRVCMTDSPDNRLPLPKPEGYDRSLYELVARWLSGTKTDIFKKFDRITRDKVDVNNHGAVSTDFIGANHSWPEADYRTRELIFQSHVTYQQGLHWFMANDPSVPEEIREEYGKWGLARDEFTDTGGWSHQLYVREARRMTSDAVVTEQLCLGRESCEDPIGLAAYQMDSHNCNRLAFGDVVLNEGDVQVKLPAPYGISAKAIVPPTGSIENLSVPVCISASHIAFGSVRMEPVFMILAESAAIMVCQQLEDETPIQSIDYQSLRHRLEARGQVLHTDVANTEAINP